jgi:glycosyltransferase involved in cell wall biosynthesis
MTSKTAVSVIVPFFNAEPFLEEAISSVFEQTFDDWELLLVDDGSSDRSTDIAVRYADGHADRVRYIEHPAHANRGPSAARNAGLAHAQGEYLAFLDADDVWLPHKLEQQVAILLTYPDCGCVYGIAQNWFGWTGIDTDRRRDYLEDVRIATDRLYPPPSLAVPYLRRSVPVPCPSDMLMRHTALANVGTFEESFVGTSQVYEDQAFTIRVALHCWIYVSGECWIKYRRHPQSANALSKQLGWKNDARRFFIEYLQRYLQSRGETKGPVWQALQGELFPFRRPTLYRIVSAPTRAIGGTEHLIRRVAGRIVPPRLRAKLQAKPHRGSSSLPLGKLPPELLWSKRPISDKWGFDRGQPIDRYYIERFLSNNMLFIRGRVLEIGEPTYTEKFGQGRVASSETLHYDSPSATYCGDLTNPDGLPCNVFDCIICTQTLHVIYDMRAAMHTLVHMLKPGGILLATLPGISRLSPEDAAKWGDFWRVTSFSARRLFAEVVPERCIEIQTYGNVLTAVAFLHGIAAEEMQPQELEYRDQLYEVIIGVRIVRPWPADRISDVRSARVGEEG